jgi:hypothetical protein
MEASCNSRVPPAVDHLKATRSVLAGSSSPDLMEVAGSPEDSGIRSCRSDRLSDM